MKYRPLLTTIAAAGLLLSACGSDDDGSAATTPATEATTAAAPAATSTASDDRGSGYDTPADSAGGTGDAAAADSTVMVSSNEALGDYLADGHGRTLYLFTADDGTTTACTGECVDAWPPMIAADPIGGGGVDAAELGTADGIEPDQVTYHGHLLYFFDGDITPGDTNGVGLPQWYAVNPAGEPIE